MTDSLCPACGKQASWIEALKKFKKLEEIYVNIMVYQARL